MLAVHLSIERRRRRRLQHACAAEIGCIWEDFIKTPPPRRSLTAARRNARLSRRSFKSDYARLFQLGVRKEAPSSSSINRVVASGGRQNESSSKMTSNTTEIFFSPPLPLYFVFLLLVFQKTWHRFRGEENTLFFFGGGRPRNPPGEPFSALLMKLIDFGVSSWETAEEEGLCVGHKGSADLQLSTGAAGARGLDGGGGRYRGGTGSFRRHPAAPPGISKHHSNPPT